MADEDYGGIDKLLREAGVVPWTGEGQDYGSIGDTYGSTGSIWSNDFPGYGEWEGYIEDGGYLGNSYDPGKYSPTPINPWFDPTQYESNEHTNVPFDPQYTVGTTSPNADDQGLIHNYPGQVDSGDSGGGINPGILGGIFSTVGGIFNNQNTDTQQPSGDINTTVTPGQNTGSGTPNDTGQKEGIFGNIFPNFQGGSGGTNVGSILETAIPNIISGVGSYFQNKALGDIPAEQAKFDQQAANYSNTVGNPNYYSPWGTQITSEIPGAPFPRPSVTTTLSPEQRALYDKDVAISGSLGDTALGLAGGAAGAFANPYDPSGLMPRYRPTDENMSDYSDVNADDLYQRQTMPGVTGRNAITDAIIAREAPRFERNRQSMDAELAARGFQPGSEGYGHRADEFNRAENDFNLAAQQAGAEEQSRLFGLETKLREQGLNEQEAEQYTNLQNRQQQVDEQLAYGRFAGDERGRELQEALALRNQPLDELNRLRGGLQFTPPQFQPYTGTNLESPDVTGPRIAQAGTYGDAASDLIRLWG